ncbi:MAG TPA: hypothetical protein PLL09_02270 [Flavobacterium sp.]|uniref:hypothetical protein n=1 Tax=unclassified Flavobacterium TaxID=196869 RepID=UPI000E92AE74|nr:MULTISPECIES: hypothetical protein [unclassified Flavobacterium]HBI02131.1 hypothetical protein [Flavobacterium sp.]HRE76629.1 hypothetical protein [Flavobacterium sp.]
MKQIILFLVFCNSIYAQRVELNSITIDSHLKMIEKNLNRDEIVKSFKCKDEFIFSKDILDEELASLYGQEIFKKQNSRVNLEKVEHSVAVRENKSKELWVVMIIFPNAMDGFFAYIFKKNNGKLIFYGNHWRG